MTETGREILDDTWGEASRGDLTRAAAQVTAPVDLQKQKA
jgi:hypothetical protein